LCSKRALLISRSIKPAQKEQNNQLNKRGKPKNHHRHHRNSPEHSASFISTFIPWSSEQTCTDMLTQSKATTQGGWATALFKNAWQLMEEAAATWQEVHEAVYLDTPKVCPPVQVGVEGLVTPFPLPAHQLISCAPENADLELSGESRRSHTLHPASPAGTKRIGQAHKGTFIETML